jgi:RIO kinase 2
MSGQDFRVLEAVEKGMQKYSLVPAPLIATNANLRHGGTGKVLSGLLRDKLLSHDKSCGYDGYRLTNAGYDILALHDLKTRKHVAAIGDRIGTGKESDIYLAVHPSGQQVVLKLHRLGRTSFRNVKKTRDYFVYHQKGRNAGVAQQSQGGSWLFLSRKSALKEFAFMKALYQVDYPTPEPIAHSRHIVVMSLVRGVPLYQITHSQMSPEQASSIFHQAADLAVRLARHGLVHCDLNEFNLMVDLSGIQQQALSQEHDPYVRHSGLSVAAESAPGMLSARGPWEPEHLQPIEIDAGSVEDEPPKPIELLDNGEPKPTVTLIDFPQMVSTQHPNASELYERDTACLFKFFSHKLQFQIPQEEQNQLFLSWESVQKQVVVSQQPTTTMRQPQSDNDNDNGGGGAAAAAVDEATPSSADDTQSVCLASKAQLRLDQDLKASGYSKQNADRDMELYYYYNPTTTTKNNSDSQEQEEGDEEQEQQQEEEIENNDEDDNDSIESQEDDEVTLSNVSTMILPPGQLTDLTRQQLQEQARLRVQQQLEAQKKKGRQRGAFRKRNSNKSYLKGKRVFTDLGM